MFKERDLNSEEVAVLGEKIFLAIQQHPDCWLLYQGILDINYDHQNPASTNRTLRRLFKGGVTHAFPKKALPICKKFAEEANLFRTLNLANKR